MQKSWITCLVCLALVLGWWLGSSRPGSCSDPLSRAEVLVVECLFRLYEGCGVCLRSKTNRCVHIAFLNTDAIP